MTSQRNYWNQLASGQLDAAVIDPNDRIGRKNSYLAGIRDANILVALERSCGRGPVLDLGCGTGSLSSSLSAAGWPVIGLDISEGLLARTSERGLPDDCLFVRFDGQKLPLADASVAAITTYVVLTHVIEDSHLDRLLRECLRVLMPGGRLVAIEQATSRPIRNLTGWKHQRPLHEWRARFAGSGFKVNRQQAIRYGRFPTTPLVRLGIVPRRAFPWLARCEASFGRWWGVPLVGYCDVLFELGSAHE